MDSCLSHIYVVWVIYVFWGRTEAHCHKPARRSLSCMCRPDRCKASEGEETNGVWRFSQTRWKSNARDLLLAIIWAFYDVLSHEIAELIHQVFMQVYVAYQQFVTTYLQYMGLFFVGYIFRIYGYILHPAAAGGNFRENFRIFFFIASQTALHLFLRPILMCIQCKWENACMQMCMCLYILCTNAYTRFMYTAHWYVHLRCLFYIHMRMICVCTFKQEVQAHMRTVCI
jgi:hypothetical protein